MVDYILGFKVFSAGLEACLNDIFASISGTKSNVKWLACINPHSYVVSIDDHLFHKSLTSANWLVPDGIGFIYASFLLNGKIRERITGSDIFFGVNSFLNSNSQLKVFFIGSTVEVLTEITVRYSIDYPNVIIAGCYSPPFKSDFSQQDVDLMVKAINSSQSDVVWVGITAPKQEKFIHQNLHLINASFVGAVGAVFDFYAGRLNRSSSVLQYLGLEWLLRLIQEPRRLWRRTFISAPIFIWAVVSFRLRSILDSFLRLK